ncbi:MAG: cob(I)yrinic acid a,c-diamide adenosyltransferase [Candidatus Thermoplasmatota archaeon]
MPRDGLGLLHVYTGDGKGKTTAALGLGMRAAGHGLKVVMIQFMKGQINYGELESAKHIPDFEIHQFGRAQFVDKRAPDPTDVRLAQEGFERAKEMLGKGGCDLLILDELCVALEWKLLSLGEVLDALRNRATGMEVVVTGRYAPGELIEIADLVTEMREVKHPFMEGVLAREGIEY